MSTAVVLEEYTPPKRKRQPGGAHVSRPSERAQPDLPYYDYGPVLSHNAEFNFIVGGRGLGKTYGAKKRAIDRAIKRQEMFIYLRRYHDDMTAAKETFFSDITGEFPAWDFRSVGNHFEMSPATERDLKKRNWTLIGYAMVLSKAQQHKGSSYPDVTTIIFDEFINEKGSTNYLPGEVTIFNNLYSTVDRWKDKTRVFFLANAVTIGNPYFVKYGILPDATTKFMKLDYGKAKGFIVAHFPDARDFADKVMQTRFGQFIDGSEYAEYAVNNTFADSNRALLGVKNPRALHYFNFETESTTIALWIDERLGEFYVHEKVPAGQRTVTLDPSRLSESKTLILPNEPIMKRLMSAFRHKKMKFENQLVRSIWINEVAAKVL